MWSKLMSLLGLRALDPLAKKPNWELLALRKVLLAKANAASEARLLAEGQYAKRPSEETHKVFWDAVGFEQACRGELKKLETYLEGRRGLILHNLDAAERYVQAVEKQKDGKPIPPPVRLKRQRHLP